MNAVTTLATIPAILALVTVAKDLGLGSKRALALAVILGAALNVADYLWSSSGAYHALTEGIILGLSAAGLYDTAKATRS